MAGDVSISLGPTQTAFVNTDAHIAVLTGPMGEGKTHGGAAAVCVHAVRCGRPIRGALIRDTHQNIKISTAPDIKSIFKEMVTFHDDAKKMIFHSTPRVEMDLFGAADEGALSKFQGPQYAIVWIEEPAPIIEKANAGLPREVFDLAVARASRQAGTAMRVQITQNPADEDHWTEDLANEPEIYAEEPETGLKIIKKVFRIPLGENEFLNPITRLANKAAFKNDPGKTARYVEGRAAPVQKGSQVAQQYNSKIHFSDKELPVIPGAIGIRAWDGWHHPCCGIGQLVPPGRLVIHDALYLEGGDVGALIEHQLIPLLESPKYRNKIFDWRDTGDPTLKDPDQSSRSKNAAQVIEAKLNTRFERGPSRWPARINPVMATLTQLATDGHPVVTLSKSAYNLHRALNGGWHFKTDNSGNRIGNLPVKDKFADFGDMFSYMVAAVFPYGKVVKPKKKRQIEHMMQRALSYGPGGTGGLIYPGRPGMTGMR